jgi:hypothetical protein
MRIAPWLMAPAVLLATGCLEGQRVVRVNVDGSGTIVDSTRLGAQAKSMLAAFEQMDQSSPAEKKAKREAKCRDRAAAMGDGVSFVSLEAAADGHDRVTYRFGDVSKLKIGMTPDPPSSDSRPGEGKEEPLTFRWTRQGGSSVLTVVYPPRKKDAEKKPAKPEEIQQGMTMMRGMLSGLKMKTVVEVGGDVLKTTSPYAQGRTVTLLELDFDQLTADEAAFGKFVAMSDTPGSFDPKDVQGLKGIKVPAASEVTIEFR